MCVCKFGGLCVRVFGGTCVLVCLVNCFLVGCVWFVVLYWDVFGWLCFDVMCSIYLM